MIRLTDNAENKLFQIISNNVGRKISYGPPPVFYWYRKVIEETKRIEQLSRIRRGNNSQYGGDNPCEDSSSHFCKYINILVITLDIPDMLLPTIKHHIN